MAPGLGYGADGQLLDNWDPDHDYGTEYARVYFRINCPLYMRGKISLSFDSEADHLTFDRDVEEVFTKLGWTVDHLPNNGVCMEVSKEGQSLYLHPQSFSGVVKKNEIKHIAEELRFNKTFKLEWVDVYDTVYDITDDEYKRMLLRKKEAARDMILNLAKTKRRNEFVSLYHVAEKVGNKVNVLRIGAKAGYLDKMTRDFVLGLVKELIEEGLIIPDGTNAIRSANKTELRKLKKTVA